MNSLKSNKVLIVGGDSFVGTYLLKNLKQDSRFEVYASSRREGADVYIDLLNPESFENALLKIKPEFVIWVAGNKNVKECENNPELAMNINYKSMVSAVDSIAKSKLPTRFIFISSDYVFDGFNGNYSEKSLKEPKSTYGRSKSMCEDFLSQSSIDSKIVRTSALMGKGGVFFDWLVDSLKKENQIDFFSNSYFSPTSIGFFVKGMISLLHHYDSVPEKILHFSGYEKLSRYELAKALQTHFHTRFKADVIAKAAPPEFSHDFSLIPSEAKVWPRNGLNEIFQEVDHV